MQQWYITPLTAGQKAALNKMVLFLSFLRWPMMLSIRLKPSHKRSYLNLMEYWQLWVLKEKNPIQLMPPWLLPLYKTLTNHNQQNHPFISITLLMKKYSFTRKYLYLFLNEYYLLQLLVTTRLQKNWMHRCRILKISHVCMSYVLLVNTDTFLVDKGGCDRDGRRDREKNENNNRLWDPGS